MGGIANADVDGVLAWTVKPPLRQPHRQPGAAACGVDNQIGDNRVAGLKLHTGHPLADRVVDGLCDQGVHDLHVVDPVHPPPDLPLQLRSARYVRRELVLQPMLGAEDVPGRPEMNAIRAVLQNRHTSGHHVVEQTGELSLELPCAARHQQVHMPALGDRCPIGRSGRQIVAFENRHAIVEIRQHPCRAETADTRANNYRVFQICPLWPDSTRYIPLYEDGKGRYDHQVADQVG